MIYAGNPHMGLMRTHPHAEAAYRIVRLTDGTFGVEVKIPDSYPTTVSSFDSEAAAEDWITRSKQRVEEQNAPRNWFRRSAPAR